MIGFDGVILAGGRASRLGGIDKPGLVIGRDSLVERAVRSLQDARTVVLVGPERPIRRDGVMRSADPSAPIDLIGAREEPPGSGPAAAIAAGLAAISRHRGASEFTIVLAADLPAAVPAVGALLAAALPSIRAADGWIAVDPTGRRQFLLAAYRTDALARSGEAVARRRGTLVGASVSRLVDELVLTEIALPTWLLADIDTPDDLAAAREHERKAHALPA